MNEGAFTAFGVSAALFALGSGLAYGAVGASSEAKAAALRAVELAATPRAAFDELAARDGKQVAVRGWAAGSWPTRAAPGGRELGAPVVHCAAQTLEKKCTTNADGEEECEQVWEAVRAAPAPDFVLLPERAEAGAEAVPGRSCRVRLSAAWTPDLERLVDEPGLRVDCLRADREISVFGRARGGAFEAGEPFLVGNGSPKDVVLAEERRRAAHARGVWWLGAFAGAAFLLAVAALAAGIGLARDG